MKNLVLPRIVTKLLEFISNNIFGKEKIKKQHILIIDDEIEVCILLEHYLTKKNKKAAYSNNIREGIDKLKKTNPNVLILDHNLPDGLGIESIATFKSLNPSLRVIVISAMSNLKNEALEKGANHFIEKPISYSALNAVL